MNINELMMTRRSVRKYSPQPIPQELLDKILQAGLVSPSSKNLRPVEFIVIKDKKTLEDLSYAREIGTQLLAGADCAIAVICDKEKTDACAENSSIAMYGMQLCAHALGLGSCWVQFRLRQSQDGRSAEAYARDILHFPEQYELEAILALGYPVHEYRAHTEDELDLKKIHYEVF